MSESAVAIIADDPAPRRAGFWLRGLAFALDLGSVALACHVAASLLAILGDMDAPFRMYAEPGAYTNRLLAYMAAGQVAAVLVYPLYAAIFLASRLRATPGKLTARIYVVDARGRRLGFWRALGREGAKWLSLASLLIGFLMAAFRRDKAALHDLLAGTRVYRLPRRVARPAPRPASPPSAAQPMPEIGKPAYVLAGLGALPVLGWPFGIAGLIWGLLSRRRHARRVALIAAVCTFGVSLFYGGFYYVYMPDFWRNQAKLEDTVRRMAWARSGLVRTACHIELFRSRYGRYPRDLRELFGAQHELDLWLSIEDPLTPSGPNGEHRLFDYRPTRDGYRLFSTGRDGAPGNRDDLPLPEHWQCPQFKPLRAPEPDRRRRDDI